jgi:hypothetical protein
MLTRKRCKNYDGEGAVTGPSPQHGKERGIVMLVVKGCLFVFGFFVVLLIVIWVLSASRGVMFPVGLFSRVGMLLIGAGLGTSVVGCGLLFLGRVALAHLNRGPA